MDKVLCPECTHEAVQINEGRTWVCTSCGEHFLYPPKSPWQPIETAPKDGTLVLVYEECNGIMLGYYRTEWREATEAMTIQPTHWQPLPEPPK